MASVFWDAHGVIFIGYLEKARMITGAYYAALLDRLVEKIRNKHRSSDNCTFTNSLESGKWLFHHLQ